MAEYTASEENGQYMQKSYETLYESYMDPTINDASGVWGFDYLNPP